MTYLAAICALIFCFCFYKGFIIIDSSKLRTNVINLLIIIFFRNYHQLSFLLFLISLMFLLSDYFSREDRQINLTLFKFNKSRMSICREIKFQERSRDSKGSLDKYRMPLSTKEQSTELRILYSIPMLRDYSLLISL